MAVDMFLKLAGIEGEAQDAKHAKEIDIDSFSWGVNQTGTSATGGGGGAGKAHFADISVLKHVDSATNALLEACATGKHITEGKLTVRKAGGNQQEYLIIKLTDILVTSVQTSGTESGERISESVSLNFAKVEFEYKEQKADGSLGASKKFGYDLKKNQKV